ncbi:MAG: glycerol kinase [Dehalococcoidales bacterium]|nr:glycerol kinase [Dehalococcoidales bacterium]
MKNKKTYVLSIDQGSTSTRAVIYDENLNLISNAYIKTREIYPQYGWVEQNPNEIIDSVKKTIFRSIKEANLKIETIQSIGITNQRESIVFWDKKTKLSLSNMISWQCLRGMDFCKSIKNTEIETKINSATGLKVDPYFSFSKIIWALNNNKKINESLENNTLAVGTIDSWIMFNILENNPHFTDITNASRTGLFNTLDEKWDLEILKILNINKEVLPKVFSSDRTFGKLNKKIFGSNIPITSVLGDQHSSLYAHKNNKKFEIKCTYGTGGFLLIDTGNERFNYNNNFLSTVAYKKDKKTTYALEGSILSAGSALEWMKSINVIDSFEKIEENLSNTKFGELIFIPALNGLGAPFWNGNIRASIENITNKTNKNDILRAALESIAFSTKSILKTIEITTKYKIDVLKIDGGMSTNSFFSSFLADLLGIKVKVATNSEMTSMGVAKMSLEKHVENLSLKNLYIEYKPIKKNFKKFNDKFFKWEKIIENKLKD